MGDGGIFGPVGHLTKRSFKVVAVLHGVDDLLLWLGFAKRAGSLQCELQHRSWLLHRSISFKCANQVPGH